MVTASRNGTAAVSTLIPTIHYQPRDSIGTTQQGQRASRPLGLVKALSLATVAARLSGNERSISAQDRWFVPHPQFRTFNWFQIYWSRSNSKLLGNREPIGGFKAR